MPNETVESIKPPSTEGPQSDEVMRDPVDYTIEVLKNMRLEAGRRPTRTWGNYPGRNTETEAMVGGNRPAVDETLAATFIEGADGTDNNNPIRFAIGRMHEAVNPYLPPEYWDAYNQALNGAETNKPREYRLTRQRLIVENWALQVAMDRLVRSDDPEMKKLGTLAVEFVKSKKFGLDTERVTADSLKELGISYSAYRKQMAQRNK